MRKELVTPVWTMLLSLLVVISVHKINSLQNELREIKAAVAEDDTTHYGIDVSHHQGDINWSEVKDWSGHAIKFVYIKATEGTTYRDPMYDKNFDGAKANGIPAGSYHYFRTTSPVESQLENFISCIDVDNQDLLPLVDIEELDNWEDEEFHKNLTNFLVSLEDRTGLKPVIYTVNSFYNRNLADKYTDYDFLIGRYGPNEPFMKDGHDWAVWQFSESGRIKGIPKDVDIDYVNPNLDLDNLFVN